MREYVPLLAVVVLAIVVAPWTTSTVAPASGWPSPKTVPESVKLWAAAGAGSAPAVAARARASARPRSGAGDFGRGVVVGRISQLLLEGVGLG